MGLNFDVRIGTSRLIQIQLLNPDDSIPTGQYLDSDVLSFAVWQGAADIPVIVKSSAVTADVAWISATNAQFSMALHPTDTIGMPQGVYYLDATATRGVDEADLLPSKTTLTLTATPGSTPARPTYIDVTIVRKVAAWIDTVTAPGSETGFLEQCADSRSWLDENIIRNYRGGNASLLGMQGVALDSWFSGGARRSSLRNPWLLNLLATNSLIVTDRTRDICAYYTLHRICEGMITKGAQYPALSARSLHNANTLLACYTAEIQVLGALDFWGQPLASIPITFSSTNTLWA